MRDKVQETFFMAPEEHALLHEVTQQRVSYVHEPTVGYFHYGPGHPMKPYRLALTHDLIMHYGLDAGMKMLRGRIATDTELQRFHSQEYISFLKKATSCQSDERIKKAVREVLRKGDWMHIDSEDPLARPLRQFNIGEDCPLFEGLYDFGALYAGSSLLAGQELISGAADIAINWSGGLHHAKRSEASGFCYMNDIVLVILDLLQHYPRVLYIDIDVHHGDGVQDAFYDNDRVLCLSLHKFGDGFFPGTGSLAETGLSRGAGFSINVPLKSGIDDASYQYVYNPVLKSVMECFQPSVVVLQCGADSLAGDRLGVFNLSVQGHGACVAEVQKYGLPMVVLGGGGYTIRNVSRCWAYETSILTRTLVTNDLPPTSPHYEYWAPDYTLLSFPSNHRPLENDNSRHYLDTLIENIATTLREKCKGAPSVQMQFFPMSAAEIEDAENENRFHNENIGTDETPFFKSLLFDKPDRMSLISQIRQAKERLYFPLNKPTD